MTSPYKTQNFLKDLDRYNFFCNIYFMYFRWIFGLQMDTMEYQKL